MKTRKLCNEQEINERVTDFLKLAVRKRYADEHLSVLYTAARPEIIFVSSERESWSAVQEPDSSAVFFNQQNP